MFATPVAKISTRIVMSVPVRIRLGLGSYRAARIPSIKGGHKARVLLALVKAKL